MAIHAGSWMGLPDFGITEKIGSLFGAPRTSQGGSNLIGGNDVQTLGTSNYVPPQFGPQQPPPINYPPGGGGGTGGGGSPTTQNSGFNYNPQITSPSDPLGGGGSQLDAINQQFNDFNNYLDTQSSTANQNFTDTKSLYDTQKANTQQQFSTDQQNQVEQAKKTEGLNLAKVRQLLSDLTQSNAARTAITGGGSVGEALASKFGQQAQSSLGTVMGTTQQTIQRANDFYNSSITKLNDTYNANILQAKQALQDNLSQIQAAKTQSAAAKQSSTIDAWRSYYDNVNQSKIQSATFKAQYDMWLQQQQSALGAAAGFNQSNNQQYNTDLASAYNNFQGTPGVDQTQISPIINPTYKTSTKPYDPNDPNNAYVSPNVLQNSTMGTP